MDALKSYCATGRLLVVDCNKTTARRGSLSSSSGIRFLPPSSFCSSHTIFAERRKLIRCLPSPPALSLSLPDMAAQEGCVIDMDALKSYCATGRLLVVDSNKTTARRGSFSSSSGIRFLPPSSFGSSHAISAERRKLIRCLPSPPALSLSLPDMAAQEVDENIAEYGDNQNTSELKTARVRFVLKKACLFGEQLLLVGDYSSLGLWNPSDAFPLQWSDGHVWTAELELPVGKSIQFKFVLKDLSGEINWQPGPDRTFSAWDTANTIVVTEDWENAENQKILEDHSTNLTEDVITKETPIESNNTTLINENNLMGVVAKLQLALNDERLSRSAKDEELTGYEEDLVLVPGLSTIAVPDVSSGFQKDVVNGKLDDASL